MYAKGERERELWNFMVGCFGSSNGKILVRQTNRVRINQMESKII